MKFLSSIFLLVVFVFSAQAVSAQDTIAVQTLTFDSVGRSGLFNFPDLPAGSYEKIIMQYRMRCKDGLVSDGANRNKGCGEWDYSCNTFITDSSRIDSVKATYPSHIITGFSGSTFNYRSQKTYNLIQHTHQEFNPGTIVSEVKYPVSTGTNSLTAVSDQYRHHRIQVVYSKVELLGLGLTTGDLTGLSVFAQQANGLAKNFKVRLKESASTTLSPAAVDTAGFLTVFNRNVTLGTGENKLLFHQNFNWSGNNGIIVEFSYDLLPGTGLTLQGDNSDTQTAIASQSGGYLNFTGTGWVDLSALDFSNINEKVAFSFWVKGNPNYIPSTNTTLFEGVDNANLRQVNCHLPWSDKNVYWDCGNDGTGYDRINKVTTTAQHAGTWNHWVLSKDITTGRLAIFRDGASFTQISGRRKPITISKMALGSSINQGVWYYGEVDGFQMWDTAVDVNLANGLFTNDAATINGLKSHEVLNLKTTTGGLRDLSSNASEVTQVGEVNISQAFGYQLMRGFAAIPRPKLSLIRGQYTGSTTTTKTDYDTTFFTAKRIVSYTIQGNKPVVIDTTYGYSDTAGTIYDEGGNVVNTLTFTLDKTINITTLNYYNNNPQRFEIMSFVTPYGIGLDLGIAGKMWEFDVSDFEPILRGNKFLSMDFGGQNQEQMDIRFLFIKGTPARTPLNIKQIWRVEGRNYQDIASQKAFEDREIPIESNAVSAKLRSAITGHGQEGEFIPQNHTIDLNNGQKKFTWQVWKGCGDNPVFPQGGTWTFDRAGWCPGMPTDLAERDITPYITPGQNLLIKYSVANPSGDSRYINNQQLVTYGPTNFSNDAAIVRITKPSQAVEFEKFNPACSAPQIILRNNGSNPLTAVTIEYWVDPTNKLTHQWTGNLNFLEETTVTLPVASVSFYGPNTTGTFTANLVSGDQYSNNNKRSSSFTMPKVHGNQLVLIYKTNLYPQENSYTVKDISGNVVASKGNFSASKIYNDTLNLAEGCYKLEFLDTGDDGLYYWYWDAAGQTHGTGYLRVKDNVTNVTKTFEPEFGSRTVYEFTVSNTLGIKSTEKQNNINIYPNPTQQRLINMYLGTNQSAIEVSIIDNLGRVIPNLVISQLTPETIVMDLTTENAGVYFVKVTIDGQTSTHKLVLL